MKKLLFGIAAGFILTVIVLISYAITTKRDYRKNGLGVFPSSNSSPWAIYRAEVQPSEGIYFSFEYPAETITINHFKSSEGEGPEIEQFKSLGYVADSPEHRLEGLSGNLSPWEKDTPLSEPNTDANINGFIVKKYLSVVNGYTTIKYYIPIPGSKFYDHLSFEAQIRGPRSQELGNIFEKMVNSFQFVSK